MPNMSVEDRQPMTEVIRIPAGTKMAQDADGKFFAVDDNDPRGRWFTPQDNIWIDGKPAKIELISIYPVRSITETWGI